MGPEQSKSNKIPTEYQDGNKTTTIQKPAPEPRGKKPKPNPTILEIPFNDEMLPILIISDIHLGRETESYDSTMEHFRVGLLHRIHTTKTRTLFILGDLFQRSNVRCMHDYIVLFNVLETFKLPIHVIPGNHDQKYTKGLKRAWKGKNVLFHEEPILHFLNFYLSHDLLKYGVGSTVLHAHKWITHIRCYYEGLIPDDSQLIVGHLHDHYTADDGLTQSIPPFSPEIGSWSYCIIEHDPKEGKVGFQIVKTSRLDDSS